MTDLSDIYSEYKLSVRGHTPIIPLSDEDYLIIFKRGLRRMLIDTARASLYNGSELTVYSKTYSVDMLNDELEYILIAAQIAFLNQMITDLTGGDHITSHKTDALSVTFSDKGVDQMLNTIQSLEKNLREIYNGMTRFSEAVSS